MILKTFKRLFGRKTVVSPMSLTESQLMRNAYWSGILAEMQSKDPSARNKTEYPSATPLLKARLRVVKRQAEIERLRRNKKKFSHLLAEQEADKTAINEGRF